MNQGVNLSNNGGAIGNGDEGNGVTIALDENSIVRMRGTTMQADRLALPAAFGNFKLVDMMTTFNAAGVPASGPVTIPVLVCTDGDGKAEKIFYYLDSMNCALTGVKATSISGTSAVINWNSMAGATNYAVFVSKTKQTNYYTAKSDLGISINYNPGGSVAWVNGLSPSSIYYVTVWANAPVTSFYGSANFTPP